MLIQGNVVNYCGLICNVTRHYLLFKIMKELIVVIVFGVVLLCDYSKH